VDNNLLVLHYQYPGGRPGMDWILQRPDQRMGRTILRGGYAFIPCPSQHARLECHYNSIRHGCQSSAESCLRQAMSFSATKAQARGKSILPLLADLNTNQWIADPLEFCDDRPYQQWEQPNQQT